MMKNKLSTKIFKYLAIFSIVILLFLFLFQVIFINTYYEWMKTRTIKKLTDDILITESSSSLYEKLERISYEENVCIELTDEANQVLYSSNYGRGCHLNIQDIKTNFIISNKESKTYNLTNQITNEKSILVAKKASNSLYIFVSTSLIPLNSTVKIIESQLIVVSIVVLILGIIIAYFISRKLSKPITNISKAALEIADGKMETNFDSSTNIKELVDLTNSLNYMKEELKKTDELQKDLMANVSHDLKTPLTMIKAYAELIKDINIDNKEKCIANLDIIVEEVDRLTALVNDILTLTKVENNITKLDLSSFDLIKLIKKIIKHHEIYIIKDGYNIIFEHKNIPKLMIEADKNKIEQVIYNFINNALNYTGKDKTIKVKITDSQEFYRVMIIDSGPGLDDSEIDHIFDKYYRSKKNHKRHIYGTGLGLSIVKNILILHNYNYGVISKKGKGTTFYFDIKKD